MTPEERERLVAQGRAAFERAAEHGRRARQLLSGVPRGDSERTGALVRVTPGTDRPPPKGGSAAPVPMGYTTGEDCEWHEGYRLQGQAPADVGCWGCGGIYFPPREAES